MSKTQDSYITLLTFTHVHEAASIRGRLETEGIECNIKDEYIVSVNPLYSNAVGGVKLQVRGSDFPRAIELLKEYGYINDKNRIKPSYIQKKLNQLIPYLDKITPQFSKHKKYSIGFRLLASTIILLTLTGVVIYFTTRPTTIERLTKNNWCINTIIYQDKKFIPETISEQKGVAIRISGRGRCIEGITFKKNGTVKMPGFKSPAAIGKWKIHDNSLLISSIDTFGFVYNGNYEIDLSRYQLVLKSNNTTLKCWSESLENEVYIPF